MSQMVVGGARRSSGVSDAETDREPCSPASAGGSEWGGSRSSLCSCEKASVESNMLVSPECHQTDAEEDCAALLLACLYCRFSDIMVMLPGTCERALDRLFPSYRYYVASCERDPVKDGSSRGVELDCGLLEVCHGTSDLLELAMEISEMCYR